MSIILDFEKMNQMVAAREDKPDDLGLFEECAWQGLTYVYVMYGLKRYDRDMCTALKQQIGREYQKQIDRFEKMNTEMETALALYALARLSGSSEVKALLREASDG